MKINNNVFDINNIQTETTKRNLVKGALRVTFGEFNSKEEVDYFSGIPLGKYEDNKYQVILIV